MASMTRVSTVTDKGVKTSNSIQSSIGIQSHKFEIARQYTAIVEQSVAQNLQKFSQECESICEKKW